MSTKNSTSVISKRLATIVVIAAMIPIAVHITARFVWVFMPGFRHEDDSIYYNDRTPKSFWDYAPDSTRDIVGSHAVGLGILALTIVAIGCILAIANWVLYSDDESRCVDRTCACTLHNSQEFSNGAWRKSSTTATATVETTSAAS